MLYIILNKSDKTVVNDNMLDESQQVTPEMVYAAFNAETMIMVHTDIAIQQIAPYYTNLMGHFSIDENGKLKEKSLTEKAASGAIQFDPELLAESEEINATEGKTRMIRMVNLGLQLKLLNSFQACDKAFELLNEESEQRIAQEYHPAKELKITKAYMEWIEAGKPAETEGKNPQQQYQAMQEFINQIKADYSAIREQLKTLIEPLKQAEEKAKTEQGT